VYLSDFDLQQLEARNLAKLPVVEKDRLLEKMLRDLIEARERLAANSSTSSRPPSSDPPWSGPRGETPAEAEIIVDEEEQASRHFSRYPKWGPLRFRERKISDYFAFGCPRRPAFVCGADTSLALASPLAPQ
jgi:hypothetical protein